MNLINNIGYDGKVKPPDCRQLPQRLRIDHHGPLPIENEPILDGILVDGDVGQHRDPLQIRHFWMGTDARPNGMPIFFIRFRSVDG